MISSLVSQRESIIGEFNKWFPYYLCQIVEQISDDDLYILFCFLSICRVGAKENAFLQGCDFPTSIREGVKIAVDYHLKKKKKKEDDEERGESSSRTTSGDNEDSCSTNADGTPQTGLYSSHSCLGSSQSMKSFRILQHTASTFPASNEIKLRVCRFKNVCIGRGERKHVLFLSPNGTDI